MEASPLAERWGYDVLINSDEETGSASSAALIAQCASGKVAALTYEPALPDGTLAGARGGTGNFTIVVRGRSAHAGRNPEEGRNAIVAAAWITLELSQLAADDITVNPARIDGGGPNNVVPDLAMLHVNFRPRALTAIERTGAAIWPGIVALAYVILVAISFMIGGSDGSQSVSAVPGRPGADWPLWMVGGVALAAIGYGLIFALPRRDGSPARMTLWLEGLAMLVIAGLVLATIFFTQSRGPWIGGSVGLIVFLTILLLLAWRP